MSDRPVSLERAFAGVSEHWRPQVIARLNGQEVKVVRFEGPFVWHRHVDEDEMFLVWKGSFDMEFRDRTVPLGPGELIVIPRGVEHRPHARSGEVQVLLFEPAGVRNTGDVEHPTYTAPGSGT